MDKKELKKISELSKINPELFGLGKVIHKVAMPEMAEKIAENIGELIRSFPKYDLPMEQIASKVSSLIPNINSNVYESLKGISTFVEKMHDNPELQFAFISDLRILNLNSTKEFKEYLVSDMVDEEIESKEKLLNKNLLPYLERLNIATLWIGAEEALNSKNPDKLRHCLISLRTILEYLIDYKLAPMDKLKDNEMFKNKFRKYHEGRQKLEFIKIKREEKIKYFTSKFDYGLKEEFTQKDIQFVCDCYSILCNVHKPNVGITENIVRGLKVKTGITIWLLIHLYFILEKE